MARLNNPKTQGKRRKKRREQPLKVDKNAWKTNRLLNMLHTGKGDR